MRLVLGCNNDERSCSSSPYIVKRIAMSEKEMMKGFERRIVDRVLFFDEMKEATP